MKNKFIFYGLTIFVVTWITGCGDPNMGYVTGKVLIDGQAAKKGLVVYFRPQDSVGSFSTGVTDDHGNYEMYFSISKKGVSIGSNKITVEYHDEENGDKKISEILNSFNDNSSPTYEVKRGKQTYNIIIGSKTK
jgi:hypothetical protein